MSSSQKSLAFFSSRMTSEMVELRTFATEFGASAVTISKHHSSFNRKRRSSFKTSALERSVGQNTSCACWMAPMAVHGIRAISQYWSWKSSVLPSIRNLERFGW